MSISCKDCGGACCKVLDIPVPHGIPAGEMGIALTRGEVIDGHWMIRSVCRYLQGGWCSDYDSRPGACCVLEVGGPECLRARKVCGVDK